MSVNNGLNHIPHRIRRRSSRKSISHSMPRNRRAAFAMWKKPSNCSHSSRAVAVVAVTTSLPWMAIVCTLIGIAAALVTARIATAPTTNPTTRPKPKRITSGKCTTMTNRAAAKSIQNIHERMRHGGNGTRATERLD